MVEVVASEEFNEFKEHVEKRLDAIEKKQGNLEKEIKKIKEEYPTKAELDKIVEELDKRIEENKGPIARIREALTSKPPEQEGI